MKICSKQAVVIRSNVPKFKYRFLKPDTPVEVDAKDVKKVLANPSFYEFKETKNLNKSGPKQ